MKLFGSVHLLDAKLQNLSHCRRRFCPTELAGCNELPDRRNGFITPESRREKRGLLGEPGGNLLQRWGRVVRRNGEGHEDVRVDDDPHLSPLGESTASTCRSRSARTSAMGLPG